MSSYWSPENSKINIILLCGFQRFFFLPEILRQNETNQNKKRIFCREISIFLL
jgi:hypothetical protein